MSDIQSTERSLEESFWLSLLYITGLIIMIFPFMCALVGTLGFLVRISVSSYHFIFSFIISSILVFCIFPRKKVVIPSILLATVLIIVSVTVSAYHRSITWDDRVYHHPAAIAMAQGWNPVYEPEVGRWSPESWNQGGYVATPHIQYFPKAQWVVVAVTYKLFHRVEAGNFNHLLFILISIPIVAFAFMQISGCSVSVAWLAGFVAGLNPIAIEYMQNGYVDGVLASLLTIFIFSSIGFLLSGKKEFVPFVITSFPFLINVKLSSPVIGLVIIVGLATAGYLYNRKHLAFYMKTMVFSILLSLVIGVNPYVTNTIKHGSPLHPFLPRTEMTQKDPKALKSMGFEQKGRVYQFALAHLLSDNVPNNGPSEFMGEHRFSFKNLGQLKGMNRGFGPLFRVGFLAAVFFALPFIRKKFDIVVLATVLASFLIIPYQGIARYISPAWVFPVYVFVTLTCLKYKTDLLKNIGVFFLSILLVNSVIILYETENYHLRKSYALHSSLINAAENGVEEYFIKVNRADNTDFMKFETQSIIDYLNVKPKQYTASDKKSFLSLVHSEYHRNIYGRNEAYTEKMSIDEFINKFKNSPILIVMHTDISRFSDSEPMQAISDLGVNVKEMQAGQVYGALVSEGNIVKEVAGKNEVVQLSIKSDDLKNNAGVLQDLGIKINGRDKTPSIIIVDGEMFRLQPYGLYLATIVNNRLLISHFSAASFAGQGARVIARYMHPIKSTVSVLDTVKFSLLGNKTSLF